VQFSKVVSYGNGPDLDSTDFLEYFAADPNTGIIAIYIEGVRDGRGLFQLLRQVCKTKPVVMWKGGRTKAGREVTVAHTGSLAASYPVWTALSKQVGIAQVENQEDLVDALLAFQCLEEFRGRNVGIISGLIGAGGGESVSATDICSSLGLEVPPFSSTTHSLLKSILPLAGTILRNPLDIGWLGGNFKLLEKALAAVAADPNIDLIIIHHPVQRVVALMPKEWAQAMTDVFIRLRKQQPKPVVIISAPGFPTTSEQWEIEQELATAQIPVYPNLEGAAKAIAKVSQYFNYREGM